MEPFENPRDFPKMPVSGGRGQALESLASTCWTLLFLAYSSSTFVGEFGHGWPAAWTIILVLTPVTLAGTSSILDGRPGAVRILISYLLYVLIPSFLQLTKSEDVNSLNSELSDLATVLIIWLPLELKLLSTDLSPTGKVTVWGLLTAALNIVNIFTVLRPFSALSHARELGYSFKLQASEIGIGMVLAVVCAVLSIPLALLMRFARVKMPSGRKPGIELATFGGLYMSAISEELLFRGLIQNMLEQRLGQNSTLALIISSVLYSLGHISKSKLGFDPPNFRLACLALVSGILCGLSWRLTGKVTGSAITHAGCDYILWRVVLSNRNDQ